MGRESFVAALRAELDAVVARYEALARAHEETLSAVRERELSALRAELAAARAESEARSAREEEHKAEAARLRAAIEEQKGEIARAKDELARARKAAEEATAKAEGDLARARAEISSLEEQARAASAQAQALEGTFAAEKQLVEACRGLEGSLLMEALRGALGRDLDATAATYSALKSRGLDALVAQAMKERGRPVAQAPLLERERKALPLLAAAAGCELIFPAVGTRYSASSMDKASTAIDPAEEGNVVECLVPGLRLAGTEGALVLPRVVVASG